jgi:hypothetical protein
MNRGRVQDAAGSQKLGPFCRGVTAGSAGALDLENEISKSCNNREIFFTKGSKVASKEMKNLFSINRPADLLEKDRATLVRALRRVPADDYERGQPRWRMPTIIDALAIKPQARRETGKYRDRYSIGRSKALDPGNVMLRCASCHGGKTAQWARKRPASR